MKTVLLTGASGLVGSRVTELLKNDFHWLTPSSSELDITNSQKCKNYLQTNSFDICLHLAAYTNVDQAETEKTLCRKINVQGTKNIFQAVRTQNKPLILVSTDFVFDGTKKEYNEKSVPNPQSFYGQTKFESENIVKNQGMIVRLSYPYGLSPAPKPGFARVIVKLLQQGQIIRAVKDLTFTPTYLDDVAYGLKYLLNHFQPKTFHLVGPETFSPFQAFRKIAQIFSLNQGLIQPAFYDQYFANKAPRPKLGKITSLYQNLFPATHTFSQGLRLVKQSWNC
jgi:dTDP-4-dehydrorhamnose reductase